MQVSDSFCPSLLRLTSTDRQGTSALGASSVPSSRYFTSPSIAQLSPPPPVSPSQIWAGHTHILGGRAGEEWSWARGAGEAAGGRRGGDEVFAEVASPATVMNQRRGENRGMNPYDFER